MKKYLIGLIAVSLFILVGCESAIETTFDPTKLEITVYDDNGDPIEGALVKLFDNEEDYNEEIATGNSNLEVAKYFTDASGLVSFTDETGDVDPEVDHFFYISFRDRDRFTDLDNFSGQFKVAADYIIKGGTTVASISLEQSKSSVTFFSTTLDASNFPLRVLLDGEEVGDITEIASTTPTNASGTGNDVLNFKLGSGIKDWVVVSNSGCVWQDQITLGTTESFTPISLDNCTAGSASFWVAKEDSLVLPISISLSPNDYIGEVSEYQETEPTACFSDGTLSLSRSTGTYNYFATSANGNCTWAGVLEITENDCNVIQLEGCE